MLYYNIYLFTRQKVAKFVRDERRRGHQGITRMRAWNQDMINASVLSGNSGAVLTHLDVSVIGPGISPAFPQGSSYNLIEKNVPI